MTKGFIFTLITLMGNQGFADETIYYDKSSSDIQIYYAEVTETKVADINALDAAADALKVDVSKCPLYSFLKTGGERYDCTEALMTLAGMPFAKRVFVDAILIDNLLVPQEFYCSLISVKTITKESVMPDVVAIGFYIDLQFVYIPLKDLKQVAVVQNVKGENLVVHEFGVVHRCSAEANPSKYRWYMEFKPNIVVESGSDLYRNWDNSFSNYKMFEESQVIDRRLEIETGKKTTSLHLY